MPRVESEHAAVPVQVSQERLQLIGILAVAVTVHRRQIASLREENHSARNDIHMPAMCPELLIEINYFRSEKVSYGCHCGDSVTS